MQIRNLVLITFVASSLFLSEFVPACGATQPHQFTLPEGFSSQRIAGPPLVSHPTMGCFDDVGRFFVCDGAGVNMSAAELEEHLPNHIKMLEDQDGDGTFDKSTVFADRMTFPMGAAWHDGALFVASPPNIWRLEDTTGDGIADKRDIIVDSFGYTGNAASIHGCFFSPDGRMYWCDGYHGHEFRDEEGNITSKRKGSYIFSCWPDGTDVRIHCGGGMDNPVEVDFTEEGDVIGTVNILYNRPRSDCLVHWQYGGTYPHREAVLEELQVTGDLLGPIHNFGHVAVSGTTRYRSGVMDNGWDNNFFVTQFNLGKIVRVELERSGSTYSCVERQFLSCGNRDFHPTDVIEDSDGSLIVIDTGGWFYRGCPTSQIAKPDIPGGIYRIRRDDMPILADPRGNSIDWNGRTSEQLIHDLADERFAVREKAIQECVRRSNTMIDQLANAAVSGDATLRRNAIWAITRLIQSNREVPSSADLLQKCRSTLLAALHDTDPGIRQTAWHGIGAVRLLEHLDHGVKPSEPTTAADGTWEIITESLSHETVAAVRREAWAAISVHELNDTQLFMSGLLIGNHTESAVWKTADRAERHAVNYALLDLLSHMIRQAPDDFRRYTLDLDGKFATDLHADEYLIVLDQVAPVLPGKLLRACIESGDAKLVATAARSSRRDIESGRMSKTDQEPLNKVAAARLKSVLSSDSVAERDDLVGAIVEAFGKSDGVRAVVIDTLESKEESSQTKIGLLKLLTASAVGSSPTLVSVLGDFMKSNNVEIRLAAIEAAGNVNPGALMETISKLYTDQKQPVVVRLSALRAAVKRSGSLNDEMFRLIVRMIDDGSPMEQAGGAQILGGLSLTAKQLATVTSLLNEAGPQQLNDLISLFRRSHTLDQSTMFLDNIENARSLNSVPALTVSEIVKRFPPELHDRANALLDRMHAQEQQKLLKLDSLVAELKTGDTARGRSVFFSEKAKCSTCHVVGRNESGELLGKRVGPDLTTIGASRTPQDLLESIIFPSSTIVRQYEPYTLVTNNGRTYSGLILRDTAESVVIQQATGEPLSVARDDVDELIPATVSIMPKGLDEDLSAQQIADLVVWLQSLK